MTNRALSTLLFISALICVASHGAHASTFYKDTGWKLEPDRTGTYTVLPDTRPGMASTTGCTITSCNRSGSMGGPVGKPRPTLSPSSIFPKSNIASGALALGSRLLPWVSVGYGLYDWYTSAGLTLDENGSPAEYQGGSTSASESWKPSSTAGGLSTNQMYSSASSICAAYRSGVYASMADTGLYSSHSVSVTEVPVSSTRVGCHLTGPWVRTNGTTGNLDVTYHANKFDSGVSRCFDSYGVFVGNTTGGLCPQGTLTPLSQADAQQRLNDAPVSADVLRRSFNEILDAGGGVASTGTSVTGPASVPGETTTKTTTSANGTTQVSTTTTNYNYTYNDNRVTVTETKTTQNPDGSTETETTDEPKDECAKNPEALQCKELGQEDGSPTWETKTVLFQAENLGLSGACPAPWVANLRGWNLTMSYQPVCDVAPTVRLGLLAVTALMCIFVVIRVTQS